ncbi:MAG: hypothetical protein ACPGVD_04730 [Flavobacteriales bacterium]
MEDSSQHFSFDSFLRETISFYLKLWSIVKKGIVSYWKHSLVLFIFFGLFFLFKARKTETYFDATSCYVKNFLPKKVYGDKLYDLEKMLKKSDYPSVARTLKISNNLSKTLISIEGKNIKGSPLHEDLTDMNVPFYIHVKLNNIDSIEKIQSVLTDFLQSGDFIKNYISEEKIKLNKELLFIKNEINLLDSLKNNPNNESPELGVLLNLSKEKWIRKLDIEKKLKLTTSVSLLKSFQPIKATKDAKLKLIGLKLGLIWLGISLIISTFLYWYNHPSNEF